METSVIHTCRNTRTTRWYSARLFSELRLHNGNGRVLHSEAYFKEQFPRIQFVVCSDDITWCREHVRDESVVYSEGWPGAWRYITTTGRVPCCSSSISSPSQTISTLRGLPYLWKTGPGNVASNWHQCTPAVTLSAYQWKPPAISRYCRLFSKHNTTLFSDCFFMLLETNSHRQWYRSPRQRHDTVVSDRPFQSFGVSRTTVIYVRMVRTVHDRQCRRLRETRVIQHVVKLDITTSSDGWLHVDKDTCT